MTNYRFLLTFFLLWGTLVFAQETDYFQQKLKYNIKVLLDDKNHILYGKEELTYINQSPDTLHEIWMHLWPNAYKDNNSAFAEQKRKMNDFSFETAPAKKRGHIDGLHFTVNGKKTPWEFHPEHKDICRLILQTPLKSGDSILIKTPFQVQIPGSYSRFGHLGNSYQITQWYPKPAVYDREGWHAFPYLDLGEFYSEYASYDVFITLPSNYVVAATGELMTPSETEWLEKKAAKSAKKEYPGPLALPPSSSDSIKTIHFQQDKIHDFAWFADKRYEVLKNEITLPRSGKTVTTWAFFPPYVGTQWRKVPIYINEALSLYSKWNIDYPYKSCTAVYGCIEAGGGMEYPMITVIGNQSSPEMLEMVVMHEVGHNWFYGLLGFNERRYPFLDEGLNSFYEMRYMGVRHPNMPLYKALTSNTGFAKFMNIDKIPYQNYYRYSFLLPSRDGLDQPMDLSSEEYSSMNYGGVIYHKSVLAFNYLHNAIGPQKWDSLMQSFFHEWSYKHPSPKDLRNHLEKESGQDLSWFFDELVSTTKKVDYKILRKKDDQILIKNSGDIVAPLNITGVSQGQEQWDTWHEGFSGKKWIPLPKESDEIKLFGTDLSPEWNAKNNTWSKHRLFHKSQPLDVSVINLVEKEELNQVGIWPSMGWNLYDKYMLGLWLYSPMIPTPKWEYDIMPMYGFGSNQLTGYGKITRNFLPQGSPWRKIALSIDGLQYASNKEGIPTQRLAGSLDLNFRPKDYTIDAHHKLSLQAILTSTPILSENGDLKPFFLASWDYTGATYRNPLSLNLEYQNGQDFNKLSFTTNWKVQGQDEKNILDIRFFTGFMFGHSKEVNDIYKLRVSGSGGWEDYLLNHPYVGRYESYATPERGGFWSQQYVQDQGGFATPYYGRSDNWLSALNIKLDLPFLPVNLYGNMAVYDETDHYNMMQPPNWRAPQNGGKTQFNAELGFHLDLKVAQVFFPFWVSKDINSYNKSINDKYWQRVRFTIDLNPYTLREFLKSQVGM